MKYRVRKSPPARVALGLEIKGGPICCYSLGMLRKYLRLLELHKKVSKTDSRKILGKARVAGLPEKQATEHDIKWFAKYLHVFQKM